MLGRWLGNARGACYTRVLSAGMDYHISHKAVAFLQDKNKHYNLAEWAVWYNFINLNGVCGLRECIHGHFTVHKLEQFTLKTELAVS